MRLPTADRKAAIARAPLTLSLACALAACGGGAANAPGVASVDAYDPGPRANGPSADYPVLVGEPYLVGDTEYVPIDTLNYDHVGYVALDEGAAGYSGAHHTLPVPSYVEVTSLDSGRTVLVRLERRGPMASNHLVALSPAALVQLGVSQEAAVRVRRVNPPEAQRYLLRAGEAAAEPLATPESLLAVLRRRLPQNGLATLLAPEDRLIETVALEPSVAATAEAVPVLPPVEELTEREPAIAESYDEETNPAPVDKAQVKESAPARQTAAEGRFFVQAAAFANRANADRAAAALDGTISQSGRFYRVRTGPFATSGEAEASLAIVRRAGYSDARILTGG